jgi:hypothetical protein
MKRGKKKKVPLRLHLLLKRHTLFYLIKFFVGPAMVEVITPGQRKSFRRQHAARGPRVVPA